MNNSIKLLLTAVATSALCACTPPSHNGITHQSSSIIKLNAQEVKNNPSLSSKQKAEELARIGEQLFTPTGFMYAQTLFNQALQLDPHNLLAQFYKNLNGINMTLRGMMVRIKPMIVTPKDRANYKNVLAHVPNSALKTFLFDGTPNIRDSKDVQAYADNLYAALERLREFLSAHKNSHLTLDLNDWTLWTGIHRAKEKCIASKVGDTGSYSLTNCDYTHALQVNLNRADFEGMQQIVAGEEIYFAALNSYNLTGSIRTSRKFQNQNVSDAVIYRELSKYPEFATLRTPIYLRHIEKLGVDAIAAIRWAKSLQNKLCSTGTPNPNNRPGYLFDSGFCIGEKTADGRSVNGILKTAELILAGVPYSVLVNNVYPTVITPTKYLNNPIVDLKKLDPVFNSCGLIQRVSDVTLGGIFPDHDANKVLSITSKCQY